MNCSSQINYQIIKTTSDLKDVAQVLAKENMVAVDLEADSMYHFKEKVCLVQMAAKGINAIIDPLDVKDLSPLKPLFKDKNIKKIFHGSDYDIRSLHRDFNIEVNNLFDTQLASMFLGIKATGLDAVLKTRFNVDIDKKYQKKDWSQRPLPKEMLEYAARDVGFLIPLTEILEGELEKKGRFSWITEECGLLTRVRHKTNNSEPLYLNFNGAGLLDPRSLAVLEALLKFRLKIAQKKDKPLYKILENKPLIQIALEKPVNGNQLKKMRILGKKQIEMYGAKLIEIIKNELEKSSHDLPVYPRKAPLVPGHLDHIKIKALKLKIKALKSWRSKRAQQVGIDPGILLNNTILNKIIVLNPEKQKDLFQIENMKKWQINTFGNEIIKFLKKDNYSADMYGNRYNQIKP
ncbi:MAG TPA: ribonuclease D [Desulfobacteraceae bacterium]|nr:ribonuclease D [Desulfobacteraceae bacterium]